MITRANVRAGAAVLAVVMCTGAVVAVHAWASTAEDADPSPPDPLTIARDAVIR
ncbi:MAG: hypothetical protein JOZ99_10015, partial [Actinobacteria bacterium]|nr:hypothetical protein [Actinomycetota bacterium]